MIKIEVTGNSIGEVADKLLALGHSLYSKTVVPIANGGTGAQTLEEVMGVAEAAPVDPTPAPKSAPVAEVSESQPTTTEPSSTPAPAAKDDVPDFDTVVTPLVLKLVEVKGKPAAQEVLGRFGVIKASQLSSERWQELVDAINDELAA